MDCKLIEDELLGFHFGVLAATARSAIEAHLLDCGNCLRAYLSLKRAAEGMVEGDELPRPSDATRQRLRREVASRIRRPGKQIAVRTALVAATLLVVAGGVLSWRALHRRPAPAALQELDDSARLMPASLDVM